MMSDAPPEQQLDWSDAGVDGAYRFLKRLWRAVHLFAAARPGAAGEQHAEEREALRRLTHRTIVKVGDDYGRRQTFNTAIAAIRELSNAAIRLRERAGDAPAPADADTLGEAFRAIALLLGPSTPHVAQALWQALGEQGVLMDEAWPRAEADALVEETREIVVQVNGKLRARLHAPHDADRASLEALALADDNVQRFTTGQTIRKVIVVPGKLVNIVL